MIETELYFYPDMAKVTTLKVWRNIYSDDGYFDEWKSKYLIDVNKLADMCDIQDTLRCPIKAVEGCYRVTNINNVQIIDFSSISGWVFEKLSAYFPYINNRWYLDFPTAIVLLKLLYGHSIPEIEYNGNDRKEGRIIRIL